MPSVLEEACLSVRILEPTGQLHPVQILCLMRVWLRYVSIIPMIRYCIWAQEITIIIIPVMEYINQRMAVTHLPILA